MKLLPNEVILLSSNEDKVILSNHRIEMTETKMGKSYNISIFLEDISSMEVKFNSYIILLIIGIIIVLAGIVLTKQTDGASVIAGVLLGGVLIWLWWSSRKHIIKIASKGGSVLNFMTEGMSSDKINDFIYEVSMAKLKRLNQLVKI